MQYASNFPQPKYPLGSEVLVRFDDSIGHTPYVSRRLVVGVLLNPDLKHFQCNGWMYLVEDREANDSPSQSLAPENDLSLPVPEAQLPNFLETIVTQLELLQSSAETWEKNSQSDLLDRLDEIQSHVVTILKTLRPKGVVQSSENPATSIDQN
ncbi:hypothetical protein NDA03_25995 [Trichocoleus sp. Lan]|uniref:hypothetical protein n=1 Tax=Trichocoleus sp. Lan TaxID=2933927 RepID=UPI0032999262